MSNHKSAVLLHCPDNLESILEYLRMPVSLKNYKQLLDIVKSRIIIPRESRSKIPLSDSGFSL